MGIIITESRFFYIAHDLLPTSLYRELELINEDL